MKKRNQVLFIIALYFSANGLTQASMVDDLRLWLCEMMGSHSCAITSIKSGPKIGDPN